MATKQTKNQAQPPTQPRHFLTLADLTQAELLEVLRLSMANNLPPVLAGKGVALVFEKPSARTRHSMELAVVQLGGHPSVIRPDEIQLGVREAIADVARTFSGYHSVVGLRVFQHQTLVDFAAASEVPVVNLLSDLAHPIQALADVMTMAQQWSLEPAGLLAGLQGKVVAYVGDSNNVARSLGLACAMLGLEFKVASPEGYGFSQADQAVLSQAASDHQTPAWQATSDPREAVAGADVVYTDVWASMGQEDEAAKRRADFAGYTVTPELMALANPEAIFLHCLPAHREEEVSAEVLEGASSKVWQQAENRMHTARGLLAWLLGERV